MAGAPRAVANRERPDDVPVKPMGNVAVIVHLVWDDGLEEWRPARAIRWTATHVMVGWLEEDSPHRERWEWLRAQDVMRSVSWLVPPRAALRRPDEIGARPGP